MERFSISMEDDLVQKFDGHLERRGYSNRSEAVRDLVRKALIDEEWQAGEEVVGVITLVYDHHDRIVSATHVHMDHHNCLEVIIVKGEAREIREMADLLKAAKGVKSGELTAASTGRKL